MSETRGWRQANSQREHVRVCPSVMAVVEYYTSGWTWRVTGVGWAAENKLPYYKSLRMQEFGHTAGDADAWMCELGDVAMKSGFLCEPPEWNLTPAGAALLAATADAKREEKP